MPIADTCRDFLKHWCYLCMGAGFIWAIIVPSQFLFEPKTTLKIYSLFKRKKRKILGLGAATEKYDFIN